MKRLMMILLAALPLMAGCGQEQPEKVIVGYVTSWSRMMPDPTLVTHLNYAFGHVTDTFDGVRIDNEQRLAEIVALKKAAPSLRVMLSVGGWGSGRFSEMVATESNRASFCASCKEVVDRFGLDGIDIDWEYPTSDAAGISASPDDTYNFTLLMRDLRAALGPDALLTLASSAWAAYIDFPAIMPYMDFINVMAYDMSGTPGFNAALYNSPRYPDGMTTSKAVQAHIDAGVPADKIVVGMPFYGHGNTTDFGRFVDFKDVSVGPDYTDCWDNEALVPYVVDSSDAVVLTYDNVRSLTLKCEYICAHGLLGAMYWECAGDDADLSLARTVRENIK